MKLSSEQKTIQHQFDSFCKKVLREEFRDCVKETQRRLKNEVLFSEMSEQEMEGLYITDEYSLDNYIFSVLGYEVEVKDDAISKALSKLPQEKRDIILLSYFLDMTDKEISENIDIVRRTVQYKRTSSLEQLKKLLEG